MVVLFIKTTCEYEMRNSDWSVEVWSSDLRNLRDCNFRHAGSRRVLKERGLILCHALVGRHHAGVRARHRVLCKGKTTAAKRRARQHRDGNRSRPKNLVRHQVSPVSWGTRFRPASITTYDVLIRTELQVHLRIRIETPDRSEEHTSELQSLMRIS